MDRLWPRVALQLLDAEHELSSMATALRAALQEGAGTLGASPAGKAALAATAAWLSQRAPGAPSAQHRGWLRKAGRSSLVAVRRWAVLDAESHSLLYYADEGEGELKGVLLLRGAVVRPVKAVTLGRPGWAFEVAAEGEGEAEEGGQEAPSSVASLSLNPLHVPPSRYRAGSDSGSNATGDERAHARGSSKESLTSGTVHSEHGSSGAGGGPEPLPSFVTAGGGLSSLALSDTARGVASCTGTALVHPTPDTFISSAGTAVVHPSEGGASFFVPSAGRPFEPQPLPAHPRTTGAMRGGERQQSRPPAEGHVVPLNPLHKSKKTYLWRCEGEGERDKWVDALRTAVRGAAALAAAEEWSAAFGSAQGRAAFAAVLVSLEAAQRGEVGSPVPTLRLHASWVRVAMAACARRAGGAAAAQVVSRSTPWGLGWGGSGVPPPPPSVLHGLESGHTPSRNEKARIKLARRESKAAQALEAVRRAGEPFSSPFTPPRDALLAAASEASALVTDTRTAVARAEASTFRRATGTGIGDAPALAQVARDFARDSIVLNGMPLPSPPVEGPTPADALAALVSSLVSALAAAAVASLRVAGFAVPGGSPLPALALFHPTLESCLARAALASLSSSCRTVAGGDAYDALEWLVTGGKGAGGQREESGCDVMLLPSGGEVQPVRLSIVMADGLAAVRAADCGTTLTRAAVDAALNGLSVSASLDTHFRLVVEDGGDGPVEVGTAVVEWSRLVHALRPAARGEPAVVALLLRSAPN